MNLIDTWRYRAKDLLREAGTFHKLSIAHKTREREANTYLLCALELEGELKKCDRTQNLKLL